MIRIKNKATARKMFNQGNVLHLFPCKANINSPWWSDGCVISKHSTDETFDHLVNAFEFYNCNHETGYYTHFYLEEKE